jgi:hypothetical protein
MTQRSGPSRRGREAGAGRRTALAAATAVLATVATLAGAGPAAASPQAAGGKPHGPALSFSPAPYGYGPVTVGKTATRTFVLTNSGRSASGRLTVRVSGAAAFAVTGDTCRSLGPGRKCRVTVRFAPTGAGPVAATLTAAGKHHSATATDQLTGTGGSVLGAGLGQLFWADGNDAISTAGLDGSDPRAIVPGQPGPLGVAADTSHVYWTNFNDGSLWTAGYDGSDAHAILSPGSAGPGVAVSGGHLYWTTIGGPTGGAVWEAGLNGSDPHTVVTGQAGAFGLAADASHLYWTTTGDSSNGAGAIWQAGLDGSGAHAIVTGQFEPLGVAVNATQVFWVNTALNQAGQGTVWAAGLDGSGPHQLAGGQDAPLGIAADASHVYWTDETSGTLNQAGLDGAGAHALISGIDEPQQLAVAPAAPPALAFTPAPFGFGPVSTSQTASQTFTLTNSGGTATGPLTSAVTGAPAFTITGGTCAGTSLAPGRACTVTVQFAPGSVASFTGTLTAASTSPAVSATDTLTGSGVPRRFLYWTNNAPVSGGPVGSVNQADLDGTHATRLAAGQDTPTGIAVDGSHLYWATNDAIREATLDGTFVRSIPAPGANGVAVNAQHLFWTSSGPTGSVWEANLDGSAAAEVVSDQGTFMGGIAADSGHIYWASSTDLSDGDGAIWVATLGLSGVVNPQLLVSGQDDPAGVAVAGGTIYWTNSNDEHLVLGSIWAANLSIGQASAKRLVAGQDNPAGLAADSGHIYWTDDPTGTVNQANPDGGQVKTLLRGQNAPYGLAVSPDNPS